MSKLLFIPRPLPEESPTSLLKRMAVMHGCKFKSDLQGIFGRTYFSGSLISRSHPIIQELSIRAGTAGEEFLSGFYESIGALPHAPPLQINGITVNADMIRKKGTAYCSECWREGCEHFIKDLKLSSYCPYHLRKYLSKCPSCHFNLCWHAPLDEICKCKHPLISPPCSPEEAANEQNLLTIFREGAAKKFDTLVNYLNCLDYRLESDTQCPANRCLLSIALMLVENDIAGALENLHKLKILYPDIPTFIISAKLALIPQKKVRDCARDFIAQHSRESIQEEKTNKLVPLHSFSLSYRQISAWLKLSQHNWKILRKAINIKTYNSRYTWKQAKIISDKVIFLKLSNGFKKKKPLHSGISAEDLQKKLQTSAAVIKDAVKEHLMSPSFGTHRKMFFDPNDVEKFSKDFTTVQLLSSQTNIPTNQIRNAMKRMKIAPLVFESSTLRLHLISTQTSRAVIEWCSDVSKQRRRSLIRRSPLLERCIPTEGEAWLPTAAAARHLGICTSATIDLIGLGLLTNARRNSRGGGYCIEKKYSITLKRNS